jgi:hypothetical protein
MLNVLETGAIKRSCPPQAAASAYQEHLSPPATKLGGSF